MANSSGGSVSVFLGTGIGSFNAPVDYPIGVNPFSIAVGDFNDDGKLDIAAVSGGVIIVLQR
jgi:hypothetical protein